MDDSSENEDFDSEDRKTLLQRLAVISSQRKIQEKKLSTIVMDKPKEIVCEIVR